MTKRRAWDIGSCKFSLITLCLLCFFVNLAFGFSTHSTTISRTFDPAPPSVPVNDPITVTVTFTNSEANALKGFYYTEQIPEGLSVNTVSVEVGGANVSNYTFESGAAGDVYPGYIPYRWILETPTAFGENNPIGSGVTLEIVYDVTSSQEGTFDFDEFHWVGYYQQAAEGERAAFGHSEDGDKQTVTFVNIPPVANDDTASTPEDTSVAIDVLANDTDADGTIDPGTLLIVSGPSNGTVTINGDDTVTYSPQTNFNGTDTFTYTVQDNDGGPSNEATVTVTVTPENDAPVAGPQSVSTDEDSSKSIMLTASDVDGDALTYSVETQPTHGTLSGTAPDLTYDPDLNYNGTEIFTFKVNDGTVDSDIATVDITVNPVNDAPAADPQSVTTDEDTAVAITLTGSDVDGDSLTFAVVAGPSNGSLSGTPPNLAYTPNANYSGSDSFDFKANDGSVDSSAATVSITVNGVNDPPQAVDDTATTKQDTSVTIDVVENDTDVDGAIDATTVTVLTGPSNGSVLENGDGTATYTPLAGFTGTDQFTYTVQDNDGATSNEATVSITVRKPVDTLDLDLKIKEFKAEGASEEEVKAMIRQYMEGP